MYPIHVDLFGKEVVVAGGGPVAYRKIRNLLKEKAIIKVISIDAVKEIQELHEQKSLTWITREVKSKDFEKAFLIVAATNSSEVNAEIAANVNENQLINVADQPQLGNFIIPSVVKRGRLVLSVSTSGASPGLSILIKKELQLKYSKDYESYLEFLYECRTIIKNEFPKIKRKALLAELTDPVFLHDLNKRFGYKKTLTNEKNP
ncbi:MULTISPECIES: precorrin-2 dehydrogenase/sirohydrochlorin ferrochelatase family protein [Fictibacillus]|uniref:precorrin-2 dehydrogenase/sirohydrochlorin ferrochelatase family protein n=1 Tax=Fictibacillus TaxID=1329200 RepID=UPI00102889DC|nr:MULTISPECIES: NAD(P)-dependent oxidoreductase [Fictibacillus]RZT22653.1 precorrin-2 dehydrogenase [Fictibacillus sp. BK138]